MTIEELIIFCEEEEYNHRLKCKRYDDASGYTRSKDKNIRTACAIREDSYADFYKEISDTMRKYQKIQADYNAILKADMEIRAEIYNAIEFERKWLCDAGHTSKDIDIALNAIKSKVKDVLEKGAESEEGK